MELDALRKEIDAVDFELAKLLEKRMKLVEKIAEEKKNLELPVLNVDREKQVLSNLKNNVDNKIYPFCERIFDCIISESKNYQEVIRK